jgi:hypothetical protein
MQAVSNQADPSWTYGLESAGEDAGESAALSPEAALLLAMTESQSAQTSSAKQGIEQSYERLAELREKIQDAIERAKEAEGEAGFWNDVSCLFGGDIATIAGVIASAALIVGTAGTGAAILAASALAFAVAGKAGEELGLDPKIVLALQLAGVAAGVCAGQFGNPQGLSAIIAAGATATQGGATVVGGAAHIAAGQYSADAIEHRAQAEYHRGEEDLASQSIDEFIEVLEDVAKNGRFAAKAVSQVQADQSAANDAVIARIGA